YRSRMPPRRQRPRGTPSDSAGGRRPAAAVRERTRRPKRDRRVETEGGRGARRRRPRASRRGCAESARETKSWPTGFGLRVAASKLDERMRAEGLARKDRRDVHGFAHDVAVSARGTLP